MQSCLEAVERGVTAAGLVQLVVRAVFGDTTALYGEDAVGQPERRQAVGDHEHRAPSRDLRHALVHDALAFVVERAGRLVKDQDARIGDQGAGDGDALALAA